MEVHGWSHIQFGVIMPLGHIQSPNGLLTVQFDRRAARQSLSPFTIKDLHFLALQRILDPDIQATVYIVPKAIATQCLYLQRAKFMSGKATYTHSQCGLCVSTENYTCVRAVC